MPAAPPTPAAKRQPRTPADRKRKGQRERQRRSSALRLRGGLVAPAKLGRDHIEMLISDGVLDTREADAVRDNARLHTRLYAKACGAAVTRILDGLLKKPDA